MSDDITQTGARRPHNGTAVLVLGILGLVVCSICGLIAWVMGRRDLKEMDAGAMDPAGRETTRAGMICGIIGTWLGVAALVFIIAYFIIISVVLTSTMFTGVR